MTEVRQSEFEFGAMRQERIHRALKASHSVSRAIPLSDTDKLTLACMDSLARQIAGEVDELRGDPARRHVVARVGCFVASLDDVSIEFAQETTRYLTEAIERLRKR